MPCGDAHARRTQGRLLNLAVVGGTCGEHFVQVPEGSRRSDAIRKIAWQEAYTTICTIRREKVLARPMSSEPLNRMNPRYKFGVWLGVKINSAECFVEKAEGVCRARVKRIEQQDRWDKETINNVVGVHGRLVDGKWTLERPTIQSLH